MAEQEGIESTFAWYAFPDDARFKVCGLHWFEDNQPLLWRFPKDVVDRLPAGVARKVPFPSGGRLLMKSDTSTLGLKVLAKNIGNGRGLDVYLNGNFYRSVVVEEVDAEVEVLFFHEFERDDREIVIYLPYHQEIEIQAIGVDGDATLQSLEPTFRSTLPIVFYGSSICQGSGAFKPGMTYSAIIGRALGIDFVNLGFGGAGKAEPEVVELVSAIPACCYVFDLGKSYGLQDSAPYRAMLHTIRDAHPDTPIVCVTPITSALEIYTEMQAERSVHTRAVAQEAVEAALSAGVSNLHLVDGVALLTFNEHDSLSADGLHPSDMGYDLIAQRLMPILKEVIDLLA